MPPSDQDELLERRSPRVLTAHRWTSPYKQNKYSSMNYTQSADKYRSDEGQVWGTYIIGYAEVESGEQITKAHDVEKFREQVEAVADEVMWKPFKTARFRVQDILYKIWSKQTDIPESDLLKRTRERYLESENPAIEDEETLERVVEEEYEKMFTEKQKVENE